MPTTATASYSDVNFAVNGGGPDSHGVTWGVPAAGTVIDVPANVPTGGTWSVGGLTNLQYNVAASTIQTGLQAQGGALASVTVTGNYKIGYFVAWPTSGPQTLIAGGSATAITNGLTPNGLSVCVGRITLGVTGTPGTKEVQRIAVAALWSNELALSAGITLKGKTTVDSTMNNLSNTLPYPGGGYTAATDLTIIFRDGQNGSRATFITGANNKLIRFSGFTILIHGGSEGAIWVAGQCDAGPPSSGVRVDNIHMPNLNTGAKWFATGGCVFGVMDHCLIELNGNITRYWHSSYREPGAVGVRDMGEGSFADDANWGSYKFWFLEDNIIRGINYVTGLPPGGGINGHDAKQGARVVQRYNRHFDWYGAYCHGTEGAAGSTAERGGRCWEQYKNIYFKTVTGGPAGGQMRSGNVMHHDNDYRGTIPGNPFGLTHYRSQDAWNGFGGANGSNPWDLNDTRTVANLSEGGFTYHPVAGLYASGQHVGLTSGDGKPAPLGGIDPILTVDTNPGWIPGMFVGFMITNLDQDGTTNGMHYSCARIKSNDASHITCYATPSSTEAPSIIWTAGNHFEVRRCLRATDQSGWGRGDYFTYSTTIVSGVPAGDRLGDTPIYTVSSPGHVRDFEASYSWGNTYNGTNNEAVCGINSGYPSIKGGGVANYPSNIVLTDQSTYPPSYYNRAPNSSDPVNTRSYTSDPNTWYPHPHPLIVPLTPTAPTITSTSTEFTAGQDNSFDLTASGTTPISWSMPNPGSQGVPTWLALSSGGTMTGHPPTGTNTTVTFPVTASNGVLPNDTKTFSLTITTPATLTVSLDDPNDGDVFTTVPATITLSATLTNAVGGETVGFYNGSTLISSDSTSPYSIQWSNVLAGTYTLTAKVGSIVSNSVGITVQVPQTITAPTIVVT